MRRYRALFFGFALLGALLLMGSGVALAQGVPALDTTPHPAHVHKGTCANLDPNPQYPLNPVTIRQPSGNQTPTPANMTPPALQGVQGVPVVLYSDTQIDVKLTDLLTSPHAINVHKSNADIKTYIACGSIGGVMVEDELDIALFQQNNSGYFGVAALKSQGDKTEVTVYLVPPGGVASGAAAATPSNGTVAAGVAAATKSAITPTPAMTTTPAMTVTPPATPGS